MPTIINSGYSHYADLTLPGGTTRLSLTKYTTTCFNKVIESAASWHDNSAPVITRLKGAYIHDIPAIDLELSFEPDETLLNSLMQFVIHSRKDMIEVGFYDPTLQLNWQYNECYLKKISFTVTKETILSVTLSLFVKVDQILYGWQTRSLHPVTMTYLPLADPIPYYAWDLSGPFNFQDLVKFTFAFSQDVIFKEGTSGVSAPNITQGKFGLPAIEFTATCHIDKGHTINYPGYTGTQMNTPASLLASSVDFNLNGATLFTLTGVDIVNEKPDFSASEHTTTFNTYGYIV